MYLVWLSILLIATAFNPKASFASEWIDPDEARYTSQERALWAAFSSGEPGPFIWNSQSSKGRVSIARNFQNNGHTCRVLRVQVSKIYQTDTYHNVTGCQVATGTWEYHKGNQVPAQFNQPNPAPRPDAGTGAVGAPDDPRRPVAVPSAPETSPAALEWLEDIPSPLLWGFGIFALGILLFIFRKVLTNQRNQYARQQTQLEHERTTAENEPGERKRSELERRQWARLEEALNDI